MSKAGEVNQATGQAYQYVFVGALEANIKAFENKFHVHNAPEKTSFKGRTGKSFSFDFNGVLRDSFRSGEVFGESKGYTKGDNLLSEFRVFLAKAYVTSFDHERHRNDYFWFVTNVPFGCSEGSQIRSFDFVRAALIDASNAEVLEILGNGHIDDGFVRSLVERLGVFILTDSYLMNTDISYRVVPGDSIWTIVKKFHGGRAPSGFGHVAGTIAAKNRLPSPDEIRSGQRIRFRWRGLSRK